MRSQHVNALNNHNEIYSMVIMISRFYCNLIFTTHTPLIHKGLTFASNITKKIYC